MAESLRSVASIRSRLGSLKDAMGTLPVGALERTETIEDFKREYGKTRSIAAVNRTLGILRHAINWGRGRTPAIFTAAPFHRPVESAGLVFTETSFLATWRLWRPGDHPWRRVPRALPRGN